MTVTGQRMTTAKNELLEVLAYRNDGEEWFSIGVGEAASITFIDVTREELQEIVQIMQTVLNVTA